jgi:hypothetical protein
MASACGQSRRSGVICHENTMCFRAFVFDAGS